MGNLLSSASDSRPVPPIAARATDAASIVSPIISLVFDIEASGADAEARLNSLVELLRRSSSGSAPAARQRVRLILTTSTPSERVDMFGLEDCLRQDLARITCADVSQLTAVRRIGRNWFATCSGLTFFDLGGLANVTEIDDYCFCGSGLTSLDLRPLANVTAIHDFFLAQCVELTALDLTPLRSIASLGDHFCMSNSKLEAIDLSGLHALTRVGVGFISCCRALTALDLSAFAMVRSVGDGFLSGCSGLVDLDLAPLRGVVNIGDDFLSHTSFRALDLDPLVNLRSIGSEFLAANKHLARVRCSAALLSLESLPTGIRGLHAAAAADDPTPQ